MAKRANKKRSNKAADRAGSQGTRAARLEKALAACLKRGAKAASRLEAIQLEVAVLRMALAEVAGEEASPPTGARVIEPEAPPTPSVAPKPASAARPAAKVPAKTPAKPAPTPPRARRAAGPGSATRTSDR